MICLPGRFLPPGRVERRRELWRLPFGCPIATRVLGEMPASPRNREALVVKESLDLEYSLDVFAAVETMSARAFDRLKHRELCFPKAQYKGLCLGQAADFSDTEKTLFRDFARGLGSTCHLFCILGRFVAVSTPESRPCRAARHVRVPSPVRLANVSVPSEVEAYGEKNFPGSAQIGKRAPYGSANFLSDDWNRRDHRLLGKFLGREERRSVVLNVEFVFRGNEGESRENLVHSTNSIESTVAAQTKAGT